MQSEKRNRSVYSKQESEMKLKGDEKNDEKKEDYNPENDVTIKIEPKQRVSFNIQSTLGNVRSSFNCKKTEISRNYYLT